ncbi:hypothetical protein N7535_000209 [Penicillium sp. DV-2018c]|nr:hypothetical protein N7461_006543 [Penicillium sp. DV-2018c]KAJ5581589.1 hypothetical protein N7535_000209 [Penicillium sp. DV-2018c]
MFLGRQKLVQAINPDLYQGEVHFQSLLVDLKDTWADLPAVNSDTPFSFDKFSKVSDDAVAEQRLQSCAPRSQGLKGRLLEQLVETDEEKA